ncbi:MAG: hypothetical protein QGG60_08855 [Anaerolineales bacterium]|nr:hypothetical protein [Anaerolineales bacterium]
MTARKPASKSNGTEPGSVRELGVIVETEARRMLAESQLKANPELIRQGWERRFVGDARQVREAVELYEGLGYETRAEPVSAEELGDDCEECFLIVALKFKTVYTRKGNAETKGKT